MKFESWSRFTFCCEGSAVAAILLGGSIPAQSPRRSTVEVAALIEDAAAGDPAPSAAAMKQARGPAETALLRARWAALRLDTRTAERELAAYFASGDTDPRRHSIALSTRVDVAFAAGSYAQAVKAISTWQSLHVSSRTADETASMAQELGIASLLANQPRQTVIGGMPASIPTMRDKAGLVRADVAINGLTQNAILDTGANLSVMSVSAAKRLGLRILAGAGSIASPSSGQIATRVAVADRLIIAGVELAHFAFLVMNDAQLSFPIAGGYQIDAIVGFPVFRALGRVRFDRAGGFAVGRSAGPALAGDTLRASGNDLYVLANVDKVPVTLHLDTGAASSGLTSLFAKRHPQLIAGLARGSEKIMGIGGNTIVAQTALWRDVKMSVGTASTSLPQITIALDLPAGRKEKRLDAIGQDVLGAFASYTLDFDTMGFELGKPTGYVSKISASRSRLRIPIADLRASRCRQW
ncbi:putative aspartyl protease [Sphingomonas faeni]|uniref:Putative aspartyl protease n=1 Tax=Sphingomonas faeni TaxID=185950 RepID=A0A2T5U8X6_9SPHN|nr:retropepsin-like aspartic protease [Sphingomonas faeni]PTW47961.1 putative aspartyl protease [Sphingomonas faeni]